MALTIGAEPVPLQMDARGTIRVGGTRLTLDTIVALYRQGETAEEIARSFDGLVPADVHAILAFYLRQQREVDAYLADQERQASAIRQELDARQGPSPLRQRLGDQALPPGS